MSDAPDAAVIKEIFSNSILANRVFLSSSVIVFYDYAVTLPTEVKEIWHAKFSGALVLFFMTRYSFIATIMFQYILSFNANPTDSLCRGLYYTSVTSVTFTQIGLLGIFSLRTYAIYQKNLAILAMFVLVGTALVTITLYGDIPLVTPIAQPFGFKFPTSCLYETDTSYAKFRSIGQCLTLVFDFAVFSLTFAKTIRHTIEMRQLGLGEGLGYYILRDGIVYFFFQMFIHAAIITVYNVGVGKGVTWEGEISTIGNTLVVNMACRLVLNLRQVSRTPHLRTTFGGVGTVVEEPAFATNPLLGNIGASLRIGPEDDTISVDEVIPLDDLDEPPIHSHDEIKSS